MILQWKVGSFLIFRPYANCTNKEKKKEGSATLFCVCILVGSLWYLILKASLKNTWTLNLKYLEAEFQTTEFIVVYTSSHQPVMGRSICARLGANLSILPSIWVRNYKLFSTFLKLYYCLFIPDFYILFYYIHWWRVICSTSQLCFIFAAYCIVLNEQSWIWALQIVIWSVAWDQVFISWNFDE